MSQQDQNPGKALPVEIARIFLMHGNIDETMHARFAEALALLEHENNQPIFIHISSFGGDAYEMFGIIDLMRIAQSPLITICTGKAMSAAALILAAGKRGERRMGKYSRLMLHEVTGGGEWGKAYELQTNVDETSALQKNYLELLAQYTGKSLKTWEKLFAEHKDKYIDAKTAKDLGIIDIIF